MYWSGCKVGLALCQCCLLSFHWRTVFTCYTDSHCVNWMRNESIHPFVWLLLQLSEFRKLMTNQLNLWIEAENQERFGTNFGQSQVVKFPRVIRPFAQSRTCGDIRRGRVFSSGMFVLLDYLIEIDRPVLFLLNCSIWLPMMIRWNVILPALVFGLFRRCFFETILCMATCILGVSNGQRYYIVYVRWYCECSRTNRYPCLTNISM